MQIGFIGLGKMGKRMVEKLLLERHEVVAWNRSIEAIEELVESYTKLEKKDQKVAGKLSVAFNLMQLVKVLKKPRVIWVMLPAGEATQAILDQLAEFIEEGDIVIDGGNSYFQDTQKRADKFRQRGIKFLGVGVSGGIIAAKTGYPLMAGGSRTGFEYIEPVLKSLAKPNGGYEFFGSGGAGHFVKMVHNGIEYGIMQSIGEGFGLLQKAPYKLDLLKIAKLYQKGTLLSGFMMDRSSEVLENDPNLTKLKGVIAESGEAKWTVAEAKKKDLPIEVIAKALQFRQKSQTDLNIQKSFAARMIASLRQAFGGHPVKTTKKKS